MVRLDALLTGKDLGTEVQKQLGTHFDAPVTPSSPARMGTGVAPRDDLDNTTRLASLGEIEVNGDTATHCRDKILRPVLANYLQDDAYESDEPGRGLIGQVQSSSFPLYDRNSQTFVLNASPKPEGDQEASRRTRPMNCNGTRMITREAGAM
jgi:hypothetical protein